MITSAAIRAREITDKGGYAHRADAKVYTPRNRNGRRL